MMDKTAYFERAYPDEDCGCPVEEWVVCGISMMIHFEPDGSLEVFADTGDWDDTFSLNATDLAGAREEAFAWARALPTEDELAAQESAL
ncbi:hypothetical protein [Brevundimonas bullata]|uniref:hypothetical protein n=1 Tax=Brevundimonas bullata TaxID=13160 RepID=UPI003D9A8055